MSVETTSRPIENTCKSCRLEIKSNATKCNHCGTNQNFLSKINGLSLVISVLAAFGSLIALSAPAIKDVFVDKKPKLVASVARSNGLEIEFAVFNKGDAPAVLTGVRVSHINKNQTSRDIIPKKSKEIQILEPGKTVYVHASADDGHLPFTPYYGTESVAAGLGQTDNCTLKVVYRQFESGEEEEMHSDFNCIPSKA